MKMNVATFCLTIALCIVVKPASSAGLSDEILFSYQDNNWELQLKSHKGIGKSKGSATKQSGAYLSLTGYYLQDALEAMMDDIRISSIVKVNRKGLPYKGKIKLYLQTKNKYPLYKAQEEAWQKIVDHFQLKIQKGSVQLNSWKIEVDNQALLDTHQYHRGENPVSRSTDTSVKQEGATVSVISSLQGVTLQELAFNLQEHFEVPFWAEYSSTQVYSFSLELDSLESIRAQLKKNYGLDMAFTEKSYELWTVYAK